MDTIVEVGNIIASAISLGGDDLDGVLSIYWEKDPGTVMVHLRQDCFDVFAKASWRKICIEEAPEIGRVKKSFHSFDCEFFTYAKAEYKRVES
jgi:hypothetical protein